MLKWIYLFHDSITLLEKPEVVFARAKFESLSEIIVDVVLRKQFSNLTDKTRIWTSKHV